MAKSATAEFIEIIKELSVSELNGLVRAREEEFGVSTITGIIAATADGATEAVEEKIELDVELTEAGLNKVKVIKIACEAIGLGLKEAKDVADGIPRIVRVGASKEKAKQLKTPLEAEGARVTLK